MAKQDSKNAATSACNDDDMYVALYKPPLPYPHLPAVLWRSPPLLLAYFPVAGVKIVLVLVISLPAQNSA